MLASRKELVEYDRQQQEAAQSAALPLSASSTPSTPTLSPRASELFVAASEVKSGATKPREKSVYLNILYHHDAPGRLTKFANLPITVYYQLLPISNYDFVIVSSILDFFSCCCTCCMLFLDIVSFCLEDQALQ